MEIRRLTIDDTATTKRLMAEAFAGGMRPTEDEVAEALVSLHLGSFEGARLVAAATIHGLHVTWGDHDAPLGGVAGVACTVGARGQGHVNRLLAASLREMREAGQYLSGLYPFSYAFYRRHGWDWVGEKRQYSVPTVEIAADPEGRAVRTYDGLEALEVIKPVYAAFARRYRGMTTREDPAPNWWTRRLDHENNRTTYVHVHHDPATDAPDGYFTFRYPEGGQTARIGEFFALTPAAYRGLLSVMHYYGTQVHTLEFVAPADDPLPFHVMHHDLTTHISPLFMGRVVDVSSALTALHPGHDVYGGLTLQVQDDICEWNSHIFDVMCEGGQVSVTPTDDSPGVTLDIQALTQAYWGQPDLRQLRQGGRVSVTGNAQFNLLAALLPATVTFLQDGF